MSKQHSYILNGKPLPSDRGGAEHDEGGLEETSEEEGEPGTSKRIRDREDAPEDDSFQPTQTEGFGGTSAVPVSH